MECRTCSIGDCFLKTILTSVTFIPDKHEEDTFSSNGCLSPIIKRYVNRFVNGRGDSRRRHEGRNAIFRRHKFWKRRKENFSATSSETGLLTTLRSLFAFFYCVNNCVCKNILLREGWIDFSSLVNYDPLWIFFRIIGFVVGGFAWIFMIDFGYELLRFSSPSFFVHSTICSFDGIIILHVSLLDIFWHIPQNRFKPIISAYYLIFWFK